MNNDSNTLSQNPSNTHNNEPLPNGLSTDKWEDITEQIVFNPSPNFSLEQLLEHARHIPSPYGVCDGVDTNLALKMSHCFFNMFVYLQRANRRHFELDDESLVRCMLYPILEAEPELCECIIYGLTGKQNEASFHWHIDDRSVKYDKYAYAKTAVSAHYKGYSPRMAAAYIPSRMLPFQFRPDLDIIEKSVCQVHTIQDYIPFQVIPQTKHREWTPDNIKLINEELRRLFLISRRNGLIAIDEHICCYSPEDRENCSLKALLDLCPILLRFICEHLRPIVDGFQQFKDPHYIAMDVRAHEGDCVYLYVANVIRFFFIPFLSEEVEIRDCFEKARDYLPDHLRDFAPINHLVIETNSETRFNPEIKVTIEEDTEDCSTYTSELGTTLELLSKYELEDKQRIVREWEMDDIIDGFAADKEILYPFLDVVSRRVVEVIMEEYKGKPIIKRSIIRAAQKRLIDTAEELIKEEEIESLENIRFITGTSKGWNEWLGDNVNDSAITTAKEMLESVSGKPLCTSSTGIEMLWVPAGRFVMGSPQTEKGRHVNEDPHEVELSQGFWLGKYPVTQEQWEKVMTPNPSKNIFSGKTAPVESVSWWSAIKFCYALTERELSAGRLPYGYEYVLPTEAQWEYACRAGTTDEYSGGSLDEMGWYLTNSRERTHPVGQKKANPWGFHDMHGNVWEWCYDCYSQYSSSLVIDPIDFYNGRDRVLRGGDKYADATFCRSASRYAESCDAVDSFIGFRVALAPYKTDRRIWRRVEVFPKNWTP